MGSSQSHTNGRIVIDLTGDDDENLRATANSGLPAVSLNTSQDGNSRDRALQASQQQEPRRARNAVSELFRYCMKQAARVKSGPRLSTRRARVLHEAWARRRSPVPTLSTQMQTPAVVHQEPLPTFDNLVQSACSHIASLPTQQQVELGESSSEPVHNSVLRDILTSYTDALRADPGSSPGAGLSRKADSLTARYRSPSLRPSRSLPWHPATDVISLLSPSPPPPLHPHATRIAGTFTGFGLDQPAWTSPGEWTPYEAGTAANPLVILDDGEDDVAPPPMNAIPNVKPKELSLFTDGSFSGKGRRTFGVGGAGVAYMKNGTWSGRAVALHQVRDSVEAEMQALVEAFRLAKELLRADHSRLIIRTDSDSALQFMQIGWARRSYHDSLTRILVAEKRSLERIGVEVKLAWVKGHSGSAGNEMADLLAGLASREASGGNSRRCWDDPDLWTVPVSDKKLNALSARVEATTSVRRGSLQPQTKAERRQRKVEMRRQLAAGD